MIDAKTLQQFLNTVGRYGLDTDGWFYDASFTAARNYLGRLRYPTTWPDQRTYIAIEQLFLASALKRKLLIDGVVGNETLTARNDYAKLLIKPKPVVKPVPAPPTPRSRWGRQKDAAKIFGADPHKIPLAYVTPAYQMYADYRRRPADKVSRFRCHPLVKDSLGRIYARALAHYGAAELRRLDLDIFSGCFVIRKITGGSGMSMHSLGVAVDHDAAHNEFRDTWKSGVMDSPERAAFVQLWYDEGWINLGRERNFDPMHFQAPGL
jgi:hypothetical protein